MPNNDAKTRVLAEALNLVPFSGWSEAVVEKAAVKAGYDKHFGALLFPGGVLDMIEMFCEQNDAEMVSKIKKWEAPPPKVRDKIALALMERILIYSKKKAVAHRTISYMTMPINAITTTKIIWATVDKIWYEAGGDSSTDYNYYTKRLLLAGVYTSAVLYWLQDQSEAFKDTRDFIERRIDNVMTMSKFLTPFGKPKNKAH